MFDVGRSFNKKLKSIKLFCKLFANISLDMSEKNNRSKKTRR